MKKVSAKKLDVAEMRMLKRMCGATELDKIINEGNGEWEQ